MFLFISALSPVIKDVPISDVGSGAFLSLQSQLYMHLTNYSVNKHNENFERDETVDKGSKRSISWFTEFLRINDYDVAKFWGDISVSVSSKHIWFHAFKQSQMFTFTKEKEIAYTRKSLHICKHPHI